MWLHACLHADESAVCRSIKQKHRPAMTSMPSPCPAYALPGKTWTRRLPRAPAWRTTAAPPSASSSGWRSGACAREQDRSWGPAPRAVALCRGAVAAMQAAWESDSAMLYPHSHRTCATVLRKQSSCAVLHAHHCCSSSASVTATAVAQAARAGTGRAMVLQCSHALTAHAGQQALPGVIAVFLCSLRCLT